MQERKCGASNLRHDYALMSPFARFGSSLPGDLLLPFPRARDALAAKDLKREGNGADRPDKEKGPADSPALVHRQAIRQQQAKAGAKRYPRYSLSLIHI